MCIKDVQQIFHNCTGLVNWPLCVFLATATIYTSCAIVEHFAPLDVLPPLEGRITSIKKRIAPDDFCFAIMGDSKHDRGVFPRILENINNDPDISFVIYTGDAVRSSRKASYRYFLETLKSCLDKPFLAVPGNHDVPGGKDDGLYEGAIGPKHYEFHIGDTAFVMANSNQIHLDAEQSWLDHVLSQSKANRNIIVVMHHPPYDPRGNGEHHCLRVETANALINMFTKYQVSHLYLGHIHGYWMGRWGTIPYTITSGAGARLYSNESAHGFHHYLKVRIKNSEIIENIIKVKGTILSEALTWCRYYMRFKTLEVLLIIIIFASATSNLWNLWKWARQRWDCAI